MTDHHNVKTCEQTLLDLMQKQKNMNNDMIKELETIHPSHPLYRDIRYLKVLLDSSSTHILKDLVHLSKLMDIPPKEDAQ
ncbi:hypothetical protein [Bacillus sp. NPDC077027]|uniref:hypothetical protein n=1 Tax=Bacillus sp. NPDC077027 TaxID=3390548 RepID=UPI003D0542E1